MSGGFWPCFLPLQTLLQLLGLQNCPGTEGFLELGVRVVLWGPDGVVCMAPSCRLHGAIGVQEAQGSPGLLELRPRAAAACCLGSFGEVVEAQFSVLHSDSSSWDHVGRCLKTVAFSGSPVLLRSSVVLDGKGTAAAQLLPKVPGTPGWRAVRQGTLAVRG